MYPNLYPNSKRTNVENVDIGLKECKKVVYIVDKWQEKRRIKPTELLLSRGSGVRIPLVAPFKNNLKALCIKPLGIFYFLGKAEHLSTLYFCIPICTTTVK